VLGWAWTACAWVDRTPPVVSVEGPSGVVREAELVVRAADAQPGIVRFEVSIDGGVAVPLELPADGVLRWRVPDLADGSHGLRFTAVDGSAFANVGTADFALVVDRTPPALEVAPARAGQGRTLAVWVRAAEPLVGPVMKVVVGGEKAGSPQEEQEVPLYPVDGAWRGLRGIEIVEVTGPHALVVEAADELGNLARVETTFEVGETAFEEGGFIRLNKKQKEARKDDEAIKKMREERNAAYAHVQPEQRWSGPFALPIPEAELTSPFGKYRSYSDGKKSHHTGLDLSEERGTPIGAAAPGIVLVAHEQAIFGNVVIVHHGQGVATSYNHLDAIDVKEGDQVAAGQIVGKLGSTGQSTGPHLHWGLEVDVVAVDPGEWLTNGFDRSPWSDRPADPPPAPVAEAPPEG
jgi:murein DD-endopeptidase MepM/ murein hydrolase activator NlpD